MPLYDYKCNICDKEFEILKRITDDSLPNCPACDSLDVKRLISKTSFQLKGNGWYVTDYSRTQSTGSSVTETPKVKEGKDEHSNSGSTKEAT